MEGPHEGCWDYVTPRRYGIHELMKRLLGGRCTCESTHERVLDLYAVDGARSQVSQERVSA